MRAVLVTVALCAALLPACDELERVYCDGLGEQWSCERCGGRIVHGRCRPRGRVTS